MIVFMKTIELDNDGLVLMLYYFVISDESFYAIVHNLQAVTLVFLVVTVPMSLSIASR